MTIIIIANKSVGQVKQFYLMKKRKTKKEMNKFFRMKKFFRFIFSSLKKKKCEFSNRN